MQISEMQRDALTELFNIGVGRAAASLSSMVHEPIGLTAPTIEFAPTIDLVRMIDDGDLDRRFSSVYQDFSGPFEARAMLLFAEAGALDIIGHMLGSEMSVEDLGAFAQEAMSEIGNIILNACISALADLFAVQFVGSLPVHQISDASAIAANLDQDVMVLVLRVNLSMQRQQIKGRILFLLGVNSLQQLLACVDRYLREQGFNE